MGEIVLNHWIIVSAALAVVLAGVCAALAVQWNKRRALEQQAAMMRRDGEFMSRENVGFRQEIAALWRDLEAEQARSDAFEDELDRQYEALQQSEERARRAEARRTEAEKEVYASRMRMNQLQQQLSQAHQEQLAQEQLYQDIIRDRDLTIARLQENPQKRRAKKKIEALEQQITLDDILNGGSEDE